jgi:monothiol glutaredoxin
MDDATRQKIDSLVNGHKVVLFMKGTKMFPQCGFSGAVVNILKGLGADFKDVNVLADPNVREGIKEYASWPTIPQLYVGGKFVGGCDIVRELHGRGELAPLLREGDGQSS